MVERYRTWMTSLIVSSVVILWEILHYLGLSYPPLVSHPIGIVKAVFDWKFLRSFSYIFLPAGLSIVLGLLIGLGLGVIVRSRAWLAEVTLRFLRIGLWLPVLIYWTLPFWPLREQDPHKSILYISAYKPILWISGVSIVAVALLTCYTYLAKRFVLGLNWNEAREQLIREAILYAVFISLLSQVWNSEWFWHLALGSADISILYGVLLLLGAVLFLIERLFRSSFEQVSAARRSVAVKEIGTPTWNLALANVLPLVLCFVIWQLLSALGGYNPIIAPLGVLEKVYDLLAHPSVLESQSHTIWGHMRVSLLEILCGLLLASGAAFVTCKSMSTNHKVRHFLFPLLPLTYVISLVLPLVVIYWVMMIPPFQTTLGVRLFPLQTTVNVAMISFFPLLQLMWAFRDQRLVYRLVFALNNALPFAFVAMIFGEAFSAVSGLGFFMVVAGSRSQTTERLAASLLIVVLLAILSFTLDWIAKRIYLRKVAGLESLSSAPSAPKP